MQRCDVCGDPDPARPCRRCGGRIARPDLLAPPHGGALAEAVNGLRLALRGARLTLYTPRLLLLVVLPIVLSVALFVTLVALIFEYREAMRPEFASAWPWGLDWLRGFVASAAEWLAVLAAIGVSAIATILLSQVVSAPFLEWLSQAVETIVVGQPDATPFSLARFWRTGVLPILQAAAMAVVQAFFGFFFLLLSLLAVTAPLAAVGGVWLVALTLADVAIARKGFPVRERFRRVRRSLFLYLGLALPFFLAPFLLPLGVAGATLAELRERNAERLRAAA
ncbi:MAG TPA: EI24 domain-containing protein [Candidatus Binatia bacterium]